MMINVPLGFIYLFDRTYINKLINVHFVPSDTSEPLLHQRCPIVDFSVNLSQRCIWLRLWRLVFYYRHTNCCYIVIFASLNFNKQMLVFVYAIP